MAKPSIFIGSSSEGLKFAQPVRRLLSDAAEVTLWNEGFFRPGNTFIDSLLNALPRFDFAALVLTADDLIQSRDRESMGPRDNVLFELGLFMGRLGRARTFLVHQSGGGLKIPSDLAGVTAAEFEWPRQDDNHTAAVGSACDSIRDVIRDLGFIESKTSKAITDLSVQQQQHAAQLSEQQNAIRSLQFALQGIVTRYEYDKLRGLVSDQPFNCYYSDDLYSEMKRLRAMGLVNNHPGVGLANMRSAYKDRDATFDLKRFFAITPLGREYLRLRDEMLEED